MEVVFFHSSKGPQVGIKLEESDNKLTLNIPKQEKDGDFVDGETTQLTLNKNRVFFRLNLNQADWSQSFKLANELDLEEIWEVVQTFGEIFDLRALAEIIFPKASESQLLATALAIFLNPIYFEISGSQIIPKNRESVRQAKLKIARQKEQQALAQKIFSWLSGETEDLPQPIIKSLINYALSDSFSDEITTCLVQQSNMKPESLKLKILSALRTKGLLTEKTNIPLLKSDIPLDYPKVSCLPAKAPETYGAKFFTVDELKTKDFDDALHFEATDKGFILEVAISSLASTVDYTKELEESLVLRPTSIYMPDQTIHMLPPELAESRLSLVASEVRDCMIVRAIFSQDYALQDFSIKFERIKVAENITYQQFLDLLKSAELAPLAELVRHLKHRRLKAGAIDINQEESDCFVDSDGRIRFVSYKKTLAHSAVEELMILANELSATFAAKNELPFIFKSQFITDPKLKEEILQLENQYLRNFKLRSVLAKAETSIVPAAHASLGLPLYSQVTSPIRRFFDFVLQKQIFHHITENRIFFDPKKLSDLITRASVNLEAAQAVQKEAKKFYILKYLIQENIKVSDCIILNKVKNRYLCQLLPYQVFSSFESSKDFIPGQILQVTVLDVDPLKGSIKLNPR